MLAARSYHPPMGLVVSRVPRSPLGSPEPAEPPTGSARRTTSPPPGDPPRARSAGPAGRMPVAGLSRRSLAIVVGAIVVAWIVFVFARAVADSAASTGKARRAAPADRRCRHPTRRRGTRARDHPVARLPRAPGARLRLWRSGERAFALEADAPSPRPITPLGAEPGSGGRSTPLDDWLDLLFGP